MAGKKNPENKEAEGKKSDSRKERLKSLSPVLAVVVVAACAASSLTGYVPAEYDLPEAAAAEEDTLGEITEIEKGSFDLEDGYYEGTGIGYRGDITVGVSIASKQITAIDVLEESDDDSYFNRASAVIDSIMETQSLDVDTISGATYSSKGIIAAVKNALTGEEDDSDPAGEETTEGSTEVEEVEDASGYMDGTYYGSGTGYRGTIKVKVVIENGEIASISIVSSSDDEPYFTNATALIADIISGQTTNVDTVSGATYSSVGIINAVRSALSKAAAESSSAESMAALTVSAKSSSESGSTKRRTVSAGKSGSFPYPDGTYTGTAEGYEGDITVAVTLKDGSITKVVIKSTEDDEPYITNASVLLDEVVTAQSTDLDVVSGATYSSKGILNAIDAALAKAKAAASGSTDSGGSSGSGSSTNSGSSSGSGSGTDSDSSADSGSTAGSDEEESAEDTAVTNLYADGTYTVRVEVDPLDSSYIDEYPDEADAFDLYTITVNVTIESDAVTDITFSGAGSNKAYCNSAVKGLLKQLASYTGENLTGAAVEGLDTVSGATCSSVSIKEAVIEALADAAAAQEETLSTLGLDAAKTEESAIAE